MEIRHVKYKSKEYYEMLDLRYELLRMPLGLVFTEIDIQQDEMDFHLALFLNDKIKGTLVLSPAEDKIIKMRQVAIHPSLQKKGYGKKLVKFSENFAYKNNYTKISLHARKNAVSFYKKLGYKVIGDQFTEVTIPHFKMEKLI